MADANPPDSALGALIAKIQSSSSWIWIAEPSPPNAPPGDVAFRKTYNSPSGETASQATILLSVDDSFSLYVNGNLVGSAPNTTDTWMNAQAFSTSLTGASNLFAVQATNRPDPNVGGDSPAGFIAAIQITFTSGSTDTIISDTTWKATASFPSNFQSASVSDSSWTNAVVQAPYGQGPWASSVTFPQVVMVVNPPTSSTTPTSSQGSKSTPLGAILGGTLGGVAFLLAAALLGYYIFRGRKPATPNQSLLGQAPPSQIPPLQANGSSMGLAGSPVMLSEQSMYNPPPVWNGGYPTTIPSRPQYGGYSQQ